MTFTIMQTVTWIGVGTCLGAVYFAILEYRRYRRAKRLGLIRPEQLRDLATRLRGIAGAIDALAYDESEAVTVGGTRPAEPTQTGARATA